MLAGESLILRQPVSTSASALPSQSGSLSVCALAVGDEMEDRLPRVGFGANQSQLETGVKFIFASAVSLVPTAYVLPPTVDGSVTVILTP